MFDQNASLLEVEQTDKYFCELLQNVRQAESDKVAVLGRWSIQENHLYLQALKQAEIREHPDPIVVLMEILPLRNQSQIKAHHTKMMKKYKSIRNILKHLDHPFNEELLRISDRLEKCEERIKVVEHRLEGRLGL